MRDALYALPSYFSSDLTVSGVLATDLFSFNSSLGATIEQQVVEQLNRHRRTWDADDEYPLYRFERQAQRFPDVVLRTSAPGRNPAPLLGIELKGWYVLAKEREPSFRYVTTPAVSTEFDLLVVFPWALSNVVSGSPMLLYEPFVVGARDAAMYRNWHWQFGMSNVGDRTIQVSAVIRHYPDKADPITDRASSDAGGNFGRFARTGLMDDYIQHLFAQPLSGIPLDAWQRFFRVFSEGSAPRTVDRLIAQLQSERRAGGEIFTADAAERLRSALRELGDVLDH